LALVYQEAEMIIYAIFGSLQGGLHWHFEPTLKRARAYLRETTERMDFHDLEIERCELPPGRLGAVEFLNDWIARTCFNEC
jgi:hypothetical protein